MRFFTYGLLSLCVGRQVVIEQATKKVDAAVMPGTRTHSPEVAPFGALLCPPHKLPGRAGAVRVKQDRADLIAIGHYVPPWLQWRKERKHYCSVVNEIIKWLKATITRSRASCTRSIFLFGGDSNDAVLAGVVSEERHTAKLFVKMLKKIETRSIFGFNHSSTADYVSLPVEMRVELMYRGVLLLRELDMAHEKRNDVVALRLCRTTPPPRIATQDLGLKVAWLPSRLTLGKWPRLGSHTPSSTICQPRCGDLCRHRRHGEKVLGEMSTKKIVHQRPLGVSHLSARALPSSVTQCALRPDGTQCELDVCCTSALSAHQRFARTFEGDQQQGFHVLGSLLVHFNQRAWYRSSFNSHHAAEHHVTRMMTTGSCFVDGAIIDRPIVQPKNISCLAQLL